MSDTDRTRVTLPAPNESSVPGPLPRAPRMPTFDVDEGDTQPTGGSQSDHVSARLASLSDQLNSPKGTLHTLFAALEERADQRHRELMAAVTRIADEQLRTTEALKRLEPEVAEHKADIVHLKRRANGNGADNNGNGADHG